MIEWWGCNKLNVVNVAKYNERIISAYVTYHLGRWGGIFEAQTRYSLMSDDPNQKEVKVVEKFDKYDVGCCETIGRRVPYLKGPMLTTNEGNSRFGSITGW